MGYPFGTKGFRVWIPEDGKCITSRNVVFNEEELYKHTILDSKKDMEVEESDLLEKKIRCVTLKENLIAGPTYSRPYEVEIPFQGGVSPSPETTNNNEETMSSEEEEENSQT